MLYLSLREQLGSSEKMADLACPAREKSKNKLLEYSFVGYTLMAIVSVGW